MSLKKYLAIAEVIDSIRNGDEKSALEALDRRGMPERPQGRKLLTEALQNSSPEFFKQLLDRVPRGEYADFWQDNGNLWLLVPRKSGGSLIATLPALAAAMDKPEHLRLLLDWGCDVNGASLDAVTALANTKNDVRAPHYPELLCMRGTRTTSRDSVAWWGDEIKVCGLTPLAAAILFGSVDCVRLLLAREGVWLTETPAVSEALAARGEPWNTEAHRECCRLVRTRADGLYRPLCLWAAIPHMDANALRDELRRCTYSREEIVRAALVLAECGTVKSADRWSMLAVLDGQHPDALRDERMARKMIGLAYGNTEGRYEPLPAVVDHALGETVWLDGRDGIAKYAAPIAERCLKQLGKGRKLVMSRDCICASSHVNAGALRVLLKHVEFRAPSLPVGVSALTQEILRTGDLRLLRIALDRGLIPAEEPTERLLELAGKNAAARSLLLTHPRPSLGCGPTGAEPYSYRLLAEDEAERVLNDPAQRAQASTALLWQLDKEAEARLRFAGKALFAAGFETRSYRMLYALRGETETVLCIALWKQDNDPGSAWTERVRRTDAPESDLWLTPLCCAAAGGQTGTVRALLDAGFDADERDMGRPSELWIDAHMNCIALSPLLCALLWERWDTAALLLEHGAACDLTSYTVRRAFEVLHGGDVPYGDIARELGAYLEGSTLRKKDTHAKNA